MNMSSGQKSSDFLDQIMKRMDETNGSISASKKVPKVEELPQEGPEDREKLVLRFYRFEAPIVNCANKEELLEHFEKRCEWKVMLPSALQNNEPKENIKSEKVRSDEIMFTLDEVLKPWSKASMEKMRMMKEREQAEVTRLCRPDYECDPEIKTTQSRFLSDAELFKPCASTTQKKRVSKYSKLEEGGNKKAVLKEDVSSKNPIVAKRNICGFNRSKKSLREFVASKSGFKKFNTNRSKTCNNLKASTTVKKQLAFKHFQLSPNKQCSEQEDRQRAYKNRRFVKEKHNLNEQMTKYTSNVNPIQPDFTCRAKTRPSCFNPRKRKCEWLEERADKKRAIENKFNSQANVKQTSTKPIDAKYEKSLKRFMDNTKANLVKDQKSSTKLIGFIPLTNYRKRKFESKIWFRKNKLVKASF